MKRILCLHGYRQNGDLMRKRIQKLLGKSNYELICPTGIISANVEDDTMKCWWPLESKEQFTQNINILDITQRLII